MNFTNVEEVYQEIVSSKPSKSSGIDPVTMSMLKEMPFTAATCICHLFNSIVLSGKYLSVLKQSTIFPIKMPGLEASEIDSYRPINNLSTVGKVIEGIMVKQLTKYFEDNKLIPAEHHGRRKSHSTLSAKICIDYENSNNIEKHSKAAILTSDL